MMISPITEYLKYSIIAAFPFDSILLALEIFSSIPSYLLLGMTEGIRNSFHPTELFEITYSIDLFAFYFLSLSPSLFRFALSIIFVGSFLLRPLVMRPISLCGLGLSKVKNRSSPCSSVERRRSHRPSVRRQSTYRGSSWPAAKVALSGPVGGLTLLMT